MDISKSLETIRDLSHFENQSVYRFIPPDLHTYDSSLVHIQRCMKSLDSPVECDTLGHLIKLREPCKLIQEKKKVIFRNCGEYVVKERIDDSNFTIEKTNSLPNLVVLEKVEDVKIKCLNEDSVHALSVFAIQEIDKEITEIKSKMLPRINQKVLDVRISILENILASISMRIDKLEKV
jgi:hypothetical protein